MLRGLKLPHLQLLLLLSKNPAIPITTHVRLFTKPPPTLSPEALTRASYASQFSTEHQPYDGMPERTTFRFRILGLLKPTPLSPNLVAAAHCLSLKTGSLSDASTSTSLFTAYARVGDLDSSLALFNEETADRDGISWNAIINVFVKNRLFHTAITLFEEMVREFREVDSVTILIVLSALSRTSDLKRGLALHCMVVKRCLDLDTSLCNALIDLYAKSGDLCSSESVFKRVEFKDVVTWNSIITGCLCNGFPKKSALFFREMSFSNAGVDQVTLSCVVSACSCLGGLYGFGESVQGWVIKLSYESHASVANSLISFYSKCHNIETAEKVFRDLVKKNIISWNSMINGLVENERVAEAFDLLREMQSTVMIQPDSVTVVTVLRLCAEFSLLREGTVIHGFTIRRELEQLDLSVTNSLIEMYLQCDDLRSASILFNGMPYRDVISWNTMISEYSHNGCLKEESREFFRELLRTGLRCSMATLLAILPSCSCHEDLEFGRSVHCWKLKYGFSNSVSAVNVLMLMYINCGDLLSSSLLLKSILVVSDVVSWNTVIVGCVQNGHSKDALDAFILMLRSSHSNPDHITLVSVSSACGNLELLFHGRCVHGFALKTLMGSDLRVRNALITMFSRCGDIESADSVFQTGQVRNLCSWNCMISGFVQNKEGRRALELFCRMVNLQPNEITVVGILCACTQLGNLRHGMQINGHVFRFALHHNTFISASLVDMYSKCGRLDIAIRVFETSVEKSVASWNSIILAYGFHGYGRKAIELFTEMCEMGTRATKSTFISILSACSHSGLVDEGWKHYNLMSAEFGIEPTTEHHVCMVDMLGRAGRLSEAYDFIKHMPSIPAPGVWGALLSACKDHAELEMGKSIAKYLFFFEPENVGYYVSLSNMFAASGRWSDAVDVRGLIENRGLVKPPGCSFVDVCVM